MNTKIPKQLRALLACFLSPLLSLALAWGELRTGTAGRYRLVEWQDQKAWLILFEENRIILGCTIITSSSSEVVQSPEGDVISCYINWRWSFYNCFSGRRLLRSLVRSINEKSLSRGPKAVRPKAGYWHNTKTGRLAPPYWLSFPLKILRLRLDSPFGMCHLVGVQSFPQRKSSNCVEENKDERLIKGESQQGSNPSLSR
ncbi:unnamed protein product [Vicia faba]|uniref:Uncharacterized protein n=1 Tax=Vicia faba TaxID=3906 RepID=A0AAV1A3I2_VICFA|nr:unnamed protein product [Vicia faba]